MITKFICICHLSVLDKLHQLYSDLLKRMDDNCDEIRVAVARTLVSYVRYVITLMLIRTYIRYFRG